VGELIKAELLPPSADDLRAKARELYSSASRAFFDLGAIFYEIKTSEAYLEWGFGSYIEYADAEFGIGERRAQHWIEIWEKFNHKLGYTWEQVGHIGWSKLSRIVNIVENRKEASTWLKKAEKLGKRALEEAVKQERTRRRESSGEAAEPRPPVSRVEHDVDEELEGVHTQVDVPFVVAGINPDIAEVEEVDYTDEHGETTPLHKFQVYLFGPQWSNVMSAMERAGQLANSEKASHLLDMICTEFLTTYVEAEDGGVAHNLERVIKNLERVYEVKLTVDVPANSSLMRMSRIRPEDLENLPEPGESAEAAAPTEGGQGRRGASSRKRSW
jgi:hypothetical protein